MQSNGAGWWQASDGLWYPPHLHPGARRGPEEAGTAQQGWPIARPVQYGVDPAWAGPFIPPPAGVPPRRVHPALIVGAVAVVLVALVAVALPIVLRELRHYTVPSRGFVGPVPSSSSSSNSLLTPSITTAVINEEWTVFANVAGFASASELSRIASQGVVELMISRQICACGSWPAAYSALEVTAPPEPTYPLSFFAEIDQKHAPGGPQAEVAVFGKKSAGAPWLIMYLSGYAGGQRFLSSGTTIEQMPPLLVPGDQPFIDMAELLASERQFGVAPNNNPWDAAVEESAGVIFAAANPLRQNYQNDENSGMRASADFSVASYSRTFSAGSSGAQCAEIIGRVLVTSQSSAPLVQPPSKSAFGLLKPGTYSSVTETDVYQLCLEQQSSLSVFAIGLVGAIYSWVGVPAG
jgi:hypothetical protein